MAVLHVRLSPPAAKAVRRGHPWVFDASITHQSAEGAPGDIAVLHDAKRKQVGVGLLDPGSPIRVRVLHRGGARAIDEDFFDATVAAAAQRRASLPERGTTGYRVVHGENDGMGGLVVDRYADTLVLKVYSEAWLAHLDAVRATLLRTLGPERVVLRLARRVQDHAFDARWRDGAILEGPAVSTTDAGARVSFTENHLTFFADPLRGQKTGFFLDQRENREEVERRSDGARVLNVFSYSGGFSLYAARGGATSVTSLDQSRPALDDAERHFAHNREHANIAACAHDTLAADAFEALGTLARNGQRFDIVVIDPPSFAKREAEVEGALRAYGRLMRLGLGVLEPGGLVVFASCSSRVSAEVFRDVAETSADEARRPLLIEAETGHALDHPIAFPEGAYLKCLFARA